MLAGRGANALDIRFRDEPDGDRAAGARLNARRRFTDCEASVAHVAFANDAASGGIFWNVVRTFENAILAADALVIEVTHNSRVSVLFIGQNRAAVETSGINAMMAGGSNNLLVRFRFGSAM